MKIEFYRIYLMRLAFSLVSITFIIVAFHILLFLLLLQYIYLLVTKERNKHLSFICRIKINYILSCLNFMTMRKNILPFPFGPLPDDK